MKIQANPFKSSVLVDLILWVWQSVPAPVLHNLSKARTLKILFWHLNVDQIPGVYVEFGVAHGHSMRAAVLASRRSGSKTIGVRAIDRKMFGFDTFEGFKSTSQLDKHSTWEGDLFTKSLVEIRRRFKNDRNVYFHKVDASTLADDNSIVPAENFNILESAALIMFDMDLYAPTKSALLWSRQLMKPGTFLVFDEFYAFAGSSSKGESRALSEFLALNPRIALREVMTYGAGGQVFVVDSMD